MYNFLDPRLSPKVTTNSSALDGYEASNLISPELVIKGRGFIAFSSVRPPLDINFEFICNIQIRYIKITTTLGSQVTTGIEVLAGDGISLSSQIYDEKCQGVIMCDSKFYNKTNPPINNTNSYHIAYFKSYQYRVFTSTKKVCIRILRTDSRSVPCLASVEVWGYIARNCSKETKSTIHQIMHGKKDPNLNNIENKSLDLLQIPGSGFAIPEDFKDALTCEVMSLPMTLPSGNTIDQQTLEKCISNDVMYGRKPADPFTGLEFLPNRKAVVNVALKRRIDMFLMQNGHREETKEIGRTVGCKPKTNEEQTIYGDKNKRKTNYSSELKVEVESSEKRRCLPVKVLESQRANNTQGAENTDSNDSAKSNDLDDAIARVMNNSSFICFTKTNTDVANDIKKCDKCHCQVDLYDITVCEHVFCRPCLLTLRNSCLKCKKSFLNSSVVKVK